MYQVRTDLKKNRLYLVFGDPVKQELRKALKQVERLCLTLEPNFTCVTDYRNCMFINEDSKELFEKKQNRLWGLGVGKTVRVIPDSDIGTALVKFFRSMNSQYQIEYVNNFQEAETILDSYRDEIDRCQGPAANEIFKIIDMDGWEYERRYLTYDEAIKDLKQVRKSGRQTAIVVDVNVSAHNNFSKAR